MLPTPPLWRVTTWHAFWGDPTWILLWPKDITQGFIIEQATKRQPRNLQRDREKVRHEKAVDPVTGAVVGYARWIRPSCHLTAEQAVRHGRKHRCRIGDMDALEDKNYVVMDRILAVKPHIKLDHLAAHSESKGKGIGTALVTSGMKYAEMAGVPIFCTAFNAGRYAWLGFKEVEMIIQDDSQYGGAREYGAYFMMYDVPQKV